MTYPTGPAGRLVRDAVYAPPCGYRPGRRDRDVIEAEAPSGTAEILDYVRRGDLPGALTFVAGAAAALATDGADTKRLRLLAAVLAVAVADAADRARSAAVN